jgi:hypothetical protein
MVQRVYHLGVVNRLPSYYLQRRGARPQWAVEVCSCSGGHFCECNSTNHLARE